MDYGQILGHIGNVSVSSCFYSTWKTPNWPNGANCSIQSGKFVGFAENEISSLSSKLDITYFENDINGINQGYPVLKWQNESYK